MIQWKMFHCITDLIALWLSGSLCVYTAGLHPADRSCGCLFPRLGDILLVCNYIKIFN